MACPSKKQGDLTREEILNVIITYISEHGYSPTIREIGEMTGLKSTSTVHSHLNKMLEKGMIETDAGIGSSRAIRIPNYVFVKKAKNELSNKT